MAVCPTVDGCPVRDTLAAMVLAWRIRLLAISIAEVTGEAVRVVAAEHSENELVGVEGPTDGEEEEQAVDSVVVYGAYCCC
jgi:hypothetical protein